MVIAENVQQKRVYFSIPFFTSFDLTKIPPVSLLPNSVNELVPLFMGMEVHGCLFYSYVRFVAIPAYPTLSHLLPNLFSSTLTPCGGNRTPFHPIAIRCFDVFSPLGLGGCYSLTPEQ